MKQKLERLIAKIINQEFGFDVAEAAIEVTIPTTLEHGDFASNVAMKFAKQIGKSPREIADTVVQKLLQESELVLKAEVAGPGFINLKLNPQAWLELLKPGIDLTLPEFDGQKYIVEFTDPNPFKELHLGHLYQNVIGDSIARIFAAAGAEVKRADYFGDVGMHVARSLWGMIQKMEQESLSLEDLEGMALTDRMKFLGQAYALGSAAVKDSKEIEEVIKGINKQVFIAGQKFYRDRFNQEPVIDYSKIEVETQYDQSQIETLYYAGRKWSLDYFDSIYARLGVEFDYYYPESLSAEIGYPLVQKGLEQGIFTKSDGAVVFDQEVSGLHTRVFINSLGLPTYEAKELGLPILKQQDFDYDHAVILVGDEIEDYFKVLLKALELVNPELRKKTEAIFNGIVRLPEGKMSSRTGQIIRAEDFLNDVKQAVTADAEELKRDLDPEAIEKITQAAIKYGFLKFTIQGNKEFSVKNAISFEGDTGPYLLYTYVRAGSILEKVGAVENVATIERPLDEQELVLLRSLSEFKNAFERAAIDRAPNLLARYLFDLSQDFNSFYTSHRVIEASDTDKALWSALTAKVQETLGKGVELLGIRLVDRM